MSYILGIGTGCNVGVGYCISREERERDVLRAFERSESPICWFVLVGWRVRQFPLCNCTTPGEYSLGELYNPHRIFYNMNKNSSENG